ncbi:hypothetical protein Areg01_43160 [Actinoplanes regularis]|nr:hypothetical protein Areg01_43160 [Actinoplanes regularis]
MAFTRRVATDSGFVPARVHGVQDHTPEGRNRSSGTVESVVPGDTAVACGAPSQASLSISRAGPTKLGGKSHAGARNPAEKDVVECDVGALLPGAARQVRPMPCRSRGGGGASRIERPDV